MFEKLTLLLHKLGILRSGTYSRKGNAKDRGIEQVMDNVYDTEKDLIHTKDFSKKGKTAATSTKSSLQHTIGKVWLIVALIIEAIILLLFIFSGTFNFWFFVNLALRSCTIRFVKEYMQGSTDIFRKTVATFLIATIVGFFSLLSINTIPNTTTNMAGIVYETKMDPVQMVDLAIGLETDLHLEDVRISEVVGDVLEIRTNTPSNVSSDAILGAAAYIYSYVQPEIPSSIQKVRIILTVQNVDAFIIQADTKNVQLRMEGKMTDTEFITTFTKKKVL